jgi:HD-GYP domain-containing protein (c-di-GMP phosphodiesterase class II)
VIETGLISLAISLSKSTSVLSVWQAQFRWLASHYLVLGIMGLFLSIAYTALGLMGILVFTLPVFMLRFAQQQYVERTRDSVRELRRMNEELARANREVVDASNAIHHLNGKLQHLNDELFLTVGMILDARDPYVGSHAAQVAKYASAIATELGLPPDRIELLRQAGFLHDLGKIAISERVLYKPNSLTE